MPFSETSKQNTFSYWYEYDVHLLIQLSFQGSCLGLYPISLVFQLIDFLIPCLIQTFVCTFSAEKFFPQILYESSAAQFPLCNMIISFFSVQIILIFTLF